VEVGELMKFQGKRITNSSIKKLPNGQPLLFRSLEGNISVGLLSWEQNENEHEPTFCRNASSNTTWPWPMRTWSMYRVITQEEYVLWRLEN
jgi:hypothetical protein